MGGGDKTRNKEEKNPRGWSWSGNSELQPAKMRAGDKGRRENRTDGAVGEAGQTAPSEGCPGCLWGHSHRNYA